MNTNSISKSNLNFGVKKYIPLILVLILGTLLRFYNNTLISLWHDEAFSALMIKYPWGEMLYRLGLDVHPPAYYVALRLWSYVFGDSLLALRSMSIFFGVASIWAAWAFTKEAFKSEKAALWAAIFVSISPYAVTKFATEARMYTMGAFFGLLSAYFLVKIFHYYTILYDSEKLNMPNLPDTIRAKRNLWCAYVGFVISTIIIIYTHYYLFFTAAAICSYGLVYLLAHHRGNYKKFVPLLVSFFIILLSFTPWLTKFLFQLKQVGQGYWIPPMNAWSIPSVLWDMLLGFARDVNNSSTQKLLIVITLFSLYFLYRFVRKTESFHKWLVLLCITAPFAGSILFLLLARLKGSDSSVFLDRYFIFASIFYSIALAVWMKEIKIKWLAASLFVVYVSLNLFAFVNFWQELDVKTKPGMAAVSKYLTTNVEPSHKIYVGTSFMFFNYKYYNHTPVSPLLYSGGITQAKDISHFAGSALLTDADLLPEFKKEVSNGSIVWLIWTNGFGSNKPEVPLNWVQLEERSFAEVRPYVGTFVYVTQYRVN